MYICMYMYIYIYHGSIYVYIHQLEWDMLGSDGMFIRMYIYTHHIPNNMILGFAQKW